MDTLPKSATLVSYLIVTIILCLITYLLVLNIPHIKEAVISLKERAQRLRRSTLIKTDQFRRVNTSERVTKDESEMA